ncbi:MAG: thioredoxin [Rhizobiaceae bacterium]|nr:thioredoxin [Rhizobiaceae bacterium]
MSSDNAFGAGNAYSTQVSFGDAPAAQQPVPDNLIKDTTTAGFAADVIRESRNQPVLVDVWAPWCGPCKQLQPALEKRVRAAGGKVKLVKMNIDEHPSIAGQLGIQSIPAVVVFHNGQPVDGFVGAVPESQIDALIGRLAGPAGDPNAAIADAVKAAAEARAAGDLQTAAQIFDAVLQQQPENVEAIAGLAELLFDGGDTEGAEELLATAPAEKKDAAPLAAMRTRIDLAKAAAALGDPRALEQRLAADPKDQQARFDLAMIYNAQGRRDEAADGLLAIIKANRDWNEGAARAQLLKLFEAWGMTDPATLSARRKLSSLLFS